MMQGKMGLKPRWFVLFNDQFLCCEALQNPGHSRWVGAVSAAS